MEKTFTWRGVEFTLHSSTIGSAMNRSVILYQLMEAQKDDDSPGGEMQRYYFSRAMAQTTLGGNLKALKGWKPPAKLTDKEAVVASYRKWLDLPEELYDLWIPALNEVDEPVTDEDLTPGNDEKKD